VSEADLNEQRERFQNFIAHFDDLTRATVEASARLEASCGQLGEKMDNVTIMLEQLTEHVIGFEQLIDSIISSYQPHQAPKMREDLFKVMGNVAEVFRFFSQKRP